VKCEVRYVKGSGARLLRLGGLIDETFDRAAILGTLEPNELPIVVDLDGVRRITSFGVREWITLLGELPSRQYFFVGCRPAIVSHLNMVANFAGTGQVISFYCPQRCEACGHDFEALLDLRQVRVVSSVTPPSAPCPQCGADAVFDDIADAYFAFLDKAAPLVVPPAVEHLLSGNVGPMPSAPTLRVAKEVDGTVTGIWLSGALDREARLKRLADGLEGHVVVVTQGITLVTPEGLDRLFELLGATSADVMLARVPLRLALPLARRPLGGIRIYSYWLPFRCGACGLVKELGLDTALQLALTPSSVEPQCPQCLNRLVPAVPDAQLALILGRYPPARGAAPIAAYLGARRDVDGPLGRSGAPSPGIQRDYQVTSSGPPGTFVPAVAPEPTAAQGGRYELLHLIDRGGMAEVLLGRQVGLAGFEKLVVIKRILPKLAQDPSFIQMFLQEARVAARISHSNVVQIFDLGKMGDDYYIVMEYVHGWNLNVLLRVAGQVGMAMPIELACRIASEVCAGLHAAHTATDRSGAPLAIIHRDVSPHNVLVSVDGHIKITDFGVAELTTALKTGGMLKGKILYMAPETVREEPLDPRADIFAVGLVLYVCLTQRHPFEASNAFDSLTAIVSAEVPPVTQLRSAVPPRLGAIVERAMARAREDRFQNAKEMQLELESFMAELGRPATGTALSLWIKDVLGRAVRAGIEPPRLPSVEAGPDAALALASDDDTSVTRDTVVQLERLPEP
jgi:tRNA A-37 threonylcarbamoyl transferase component Bud32